jgi:hypothetical protein
MRTFGRDIPRLSWIGAKTFPQHGLSRSGNSGHGMEHTESNRTNFIMTADALANVKNLPTPLLLTDGK